MPYIIKSEQHKIRQTLRKSMIVLSNEYSDYDEYKENYQALYHLPLVRNLRVENKRLQKEVRVLNKRLNRLLEKESLPQDTRFVKQEKIKEKIDENPNIVYELIETEALDSQLCALSALSLDKDEVVDSVDEEEEQEEEEEEEAEEEEAEEEEAEEEEEEAEKESVEEEEEAEKESAEEEEEAEEAEEKESAEEEEAEEKESVEEEEAEEKEAEEKEAEEEAAEEEAETIEEESEVFEIIIKGKPYYTNDDKNGSIYACDKNGDVGDEIGQFKDGKAIFH